MAGVKGRSGGARPNSGGARPGAGRKRKVFGALPAVADQEPIQFLLAVQNNPKADPGLRVRAAIAAAGFLYAKEGQEGKKAKVQGQSKQASKGRFAASLPPKLVVNNK